MLEDFKLLNMASALARHSTQRHQVLSQNIANADTPDYKAKDLAPFAETFSRFGAEAGREGQGWRIVEPTSYGAMSPNGNNVSLETQMIGAVEAQQNHEAATAIYRKTIEILRLSLSRTS